MSEAYFVHSAKMESQISHDDMVMAIGKRGSLKALTGLLNLVDDLESRDLVHFAYLVLLGRPVDSEGESHYVLLMRTGMDRYEFLTELTGSDEFRQVFNVAHFEKSSDRHFIEELFRRVLRRNPSDSECDRFLAELADNKPRAHVVLAVAKYDEAQTLKIGRKKLANTLHRAQRWRWLRDFRQGRRVVHSGRLDAGGQGSAKLSDTVQTGAWTASPGGLAMAHVAIESVMNNMENIQKLPPKTRALVLETSLGITVGEPVGIIS